MQLANALEAERSGSTFHVNVEQLFVETLIDMNTRLATNPSEYALLRVSGLLRQILLDRKNLLEPASAAASMDVKFRVIKPGPPPIPPEVQQQLDAYYASLPPDAPRPVMAFSLRGGLLTGEPQWPGDQVLNLGREEFLGHEIITWMDNHYTVENALRVAAHSLGVIHLSDTNHDPRSQQLKEYMEGATWFGRSMPAGLIAEIGICTLRACQPLANKLAQLGLYSAAPSQWVWSLGQNPGTATPDPGIAEDADDRDTEGGDADGDG
jgi:hypothetical protein